MIFPAECYPNGINHPYLAVFGGMRAALEPGDFQLGWSESPRDRSR
jgi:hypothetical protein